MNKQEIQQQALQNATSSHSAANYDSIFSGFMDMGIDPEDIRPRENIFTYNAWKALGRQVSKGQKGVKVVTWIPMSKTDKRTGEKDTFRRPKSTTVFHISQTQAFDSDSPLPVKPEYKQPDNGTFYQEADADTTCERYREATANKLRGLADKMQSQIDGKFADRLENTPKRRAQGARSRLEGERLKRTQAALNALADMHDDHTVPEALRGITSKKAVYDLMSEQQEPVSNGYHTYHVGTGRARDTSPAALALWDTLKPKSVEEVKAEALSNQVKDLQFTKIPGYFPTPGKVIDLMIDHADIYSNHSVLEPSAGAGAIADKVKPLCLSLDLVEQNYTLADILKGKGYPVTQGDFLETEFNQEFDRILMNPPFENLQDIDHVLHAYTVLGEFGRLVSVMSPGPFYRQDKKCAAFREWFDSLGGEKIALPENSFKESGTGVNSVLIIIDKG